MAMIVVNTFTGEIPRAEKQLLPDNAAQYAKDCDTRSGSLRPLATSLPGSAVTQAVQSLYTEEGDLYFTWPNKEVDLAKSLVIGDDYQRVYFSDKMYYCVTQYTMARPEGGPPADYWWSGVRPPSQFSMGGILNATSWPDGITISARFFWESGGIRAQEADISLTQVGSEVGREYTFTPPEKLADKQGALTISATGYAYNGQTHLFQNIESVVIISETEIQTESYGIVSATSVLVNNVRYAENSPPPPDTSLSVAGLWSAALDQQAGKTPTDAIPVLQITGKKGTETVFTLYSEGSQFVRTDQPAKVSVAPIADSPDYKATIEWGGNGVIGKTVARKTSAYVVTAVNIWGEESKPSDPITVTTDYLQTVYFNVTVDRSGRYMSVDRVRIYETVTGVSQTAYHLSKEVALAGSSAVQISVANALVAINPTLETIGWDLPPAGLQGLQPLPFGSYALFRANELWFTEPFRPHTTPGKYVLTFPNNIKSIKSTAFGLIVVTTAQGYLVTGVSPDSMSYTALPVRSSIVNKRAITTHGNVAWYAGEDGVVMVQGANATLEPWQKLFTREKWRSRYSGLLESLVLASHDGYLVGLFPTGDGFMFRLDEEAGEFVRISQTGYCGFVLPQTDGLYIGTDYGIVQYASGEPGTARWWSKEFTLPKPASFGAIEICGSGQIIVSIQGDGVSQSVTVNATARGAMVRLQAGWKAQRWMFMLTVPSTGYVTSVRIAETPQELAGV